MSPELFDLENQDHLPTKLSDCYALGMVIWEVLSGNLPFYQFANWVISAKILRGDRPERPQGEEGVWFTNEVWEMLGSCWMTQPEGRPSIEDVLRCLGEASRSWRPPSPQLPVVPPRADLPTQESSDTITVGCTDASDTLPLSWPSEELDREESTRAIDQVSYPPRVNRQMTLMQRCWDQEAHRHPRDSQISCSLYVSTLEPFIPPPDRFLTHSGIPVWKRLIDHPLAAAERISLIVDLLSDRDETEAAKCLSGDDAQSFVNVVDEVIPHAFTSEDSTDLIPNFSSCRVDVGWSNVTTPE